MPPIPWLASHHRQLRRQAQPLFARQIPTSHPKIVPQVERGRQAREHFEETSPVAPAIPAIDRSVEFLDLVTACHSFVAAAGRVVPGLRDRQLGEDERTIVHENVARVRGVLTELRPEFPQVSDLLKRSASVGA